MGTIASIFTKSRWQLYSLFVLPVLFGCGPQLPDEVAIAYSALPEEIDFNFHVKPILSDKCFACHGPDPESLQADLRLDQRSSTLEVKQSDEVAIVPGKSTGSHLVERILSQDQELVMPPPESHLTLTSAEKATLIKWIDQGAEYKPHWSFIKPVSTGAPVVDNEQWARNPIDNYVLSKIEAAGLQPSPQASKSILARRLYFNLTGLPPDKKAVEEFVQDQSPEAYEKLVDQLLASPAYGERMAMEWMDVARYADSDGYLDDKHRDFSPWRDWVIQAFNENMPYHQFVTWQLAGDLLPEVNQESVMATAFNRLHRKNSEAGIVFEEYRTEYVADRTNTLGTAFLGLGLECARCHDHKYDPVTQEDYYQMFAFFNSTAELGTAIYGPDQTPAPALLLTDDEEEQLLNFIESEIGKQERKVEEISRSTDRHYQAWVDNRTTLSEQLTSGIDLSPQVYYSFDELRGQSDGKTYLSSDQIGGKPAQVKEPEPGPGEQGQAVYLNDYTTIVLPEKKGWFERTDPFSISLSVYPDTLYEEAGIFYHCEDFRLGLKGYSLYLDNNRLRFVIAHSWPENALQVRTNKALPQRQWTQITITYDGSSRAEGITVFLDGAPVALTTDYDNLYKGILYEPDIHTYGFRGFTLGARDKMKTFLRGGLDELKIYQRQLTALEVLLDYNPKLAYSHISGAAEGDPLLVEYYHRYINKSLVPLRKQLQVNREKLNKTINKIPEIMVMGDLPEPRPTFILHRGMYDSPRQQVEPGAPPAVLAFEQEFPKNRLGLTQWLFSLQNPLTARVFVNRIWQMHFGRGIVNTPDDFGSQGAIPTHPALLDWLAVTFMESGWDIKQLHKTIVMSATFRQSSKATAEQMETDPDNQLLARGPSYRLAAEMIRDQALSVSGLLVNKLGGPSVFPYQPEGLWDEISNKVWRYKYLQEPGEGLYRRSLYTIWKRTSPPPSMLIFDVPDRSVCRVQRAKTSTPLQALVLLNDPQFLEAARVLAEKTILEYPEAPESQLSSAFADIVSRKPEQGELDVLKAFYREELTRFQRHEEDARDYLNIGEYQKSGSLDQRQVAALATVISGIFNTSDSYTLR